MFLEEGCPYGSPQGELQSTKMYCFKYFNRNSRNFCFTINFFKLKSDILQGGDFLKTRRINRLRGDF